MNLNIRTLVCVGLFAQSAFAAGPLNGAVLTEIDPRNKTILMADDADGSQELQRFAGATGPKRLWITGFEKSAQPLSWQISVPEAGAYEVSLVAHGVPEILFTAGDAQPLRLKVPDPRSFNSTSLGEISLGKGKVTIQIQLPKDIAEPQKARIRGLELFPVKARADYEKRVNALRSDTTWMSQPGYGVMLQYGAWGYPAHGPRKPWEEVVKTFDVEKFAKMVDEDMGAKWVIWSITWRGSYFPMPLQSVDALVPGHTTTRDLPMDLANALKRRGIRMMFYYHPGYEDKTFWAANRWNSNRDKGDFFKNWTSIISEIGLRYGDKLAGWFFDDGCVYAPTSADYPFEKLTIAAKAGFKGRVVSYNNWVLPVMTDFQDVQMGEGFKGNNKTTLQNNGVYLDGPLRNMHAHGMFCVNADDWGVWRPDSPIKLVLRAPEAIQIVKNANEHGQAMSFNFNMYEDAVVTEETLEMFRQLKAAVYGPH